MQFAIGKYSLYGNSLPIIEHAAIREPLSIDNMQLAIGKLFPKQKQLACN